jgi:hypothetical protein
MEILRTKTFFSLTVATLSASAQIATALGTSGGTGAVASIPGSVVRGHEQGRGLISILAGSPMPQTNLSKHGATPSSEKPRLEK